MADVLTVVNPATEETIVVKPAELTPLTALRLVDHPDVAKVAFTGSTAVGRQVMARAVEPGNLSVSSNSEVKNVVISTDG